MSLLSMAIRRSFKKNDDKRDAGLTTPEDIKRFDDITYGPNGKWNTLDVYRPKGEITKLPVIVSIHGGGWVYGDKERYQYYCMSLAQHGFAVVNFTYRLAPKDKYPAPLEDTNMVIEWILDHAEEYGFDTKNIFGVGDSAGGQILALYCGLCTDSEFAKVMPFKIHEGFAFRAVGLNCGVYRIEKTGAKDLTHSLMSQYLPNKGTDEEYWQISAVNHLNDKFPPAFVMTAEGDFLVDQAGIMADKLKDLGVEAEYHYYGDPEHVLGHVFHCNMRLDEAKKCNTEECEFFKNHMC